jgi:hypothetical protein
MKPENSSLICVERDRDREEQVEIYRHELFVFRDVGGCFNRTKDSLAHDDANS